MAQLPEPKCPGKAFDLETTDLLDLFTKGKMSVIGRMPYSSNATLLVEISDGERTHPAIYKGAQGERPLRDFPSGLYQREVAFYQLAEAIGWTVVPPTSLVEGPLGLGSVQAFINANFEQHYFTIFEAEIGTTDLQKICLLDLIANSTDRKSGHCILGRDGRVYGIDNGLSFHVEWKLRTVMWNFAEQAIPEEDLAAIKGFVDSKAWETLNPLLDPSEIEALALRAELVLLAGHFPVDETDGHRWPWPLV